MVGETGEILGPGQMFTAESAAVPENPFRDFIVPEFESYLEKIQPDEYIPPTKSEADRMQLSMGDFKSDSAWTKEQEGLFKEKFNKVQAAFISTAFDEFSPAKRRTMKRLTLFTNGFFKEHGDINQVVLQDDVAEVLSYFLDKAGVDLDKSQRVFDNPLSRQDSMRLTNIEMPEVDRLVNESPTDSLKKAEFLLLHLHKLPLDAQVKLLVELNDEDFAAFGDALQKDLEKYDEFDNVNVCDVVKAMGKNFLPQFYIEAMKRRNEIVQYGEYPALLDEELQVDTRFRHRDGLPRYDLHGNRLSYEESVNYAKTMGAYDFYTDMKDDVFEVLMESRGQSQEDMQISAAKLIKRYRQYKNDMAEKYIYTARSEFSFKDVMEVIEYFDKYFREDDKMDDVLHKQFKDITAYILSIGEEDLTFK